MVLCLGVVVLTVDGISTWGYRQLGHRLRIKLEREGIDTRQGLFVNFSPDREPRTYEHYANWDVGFVFLDKNRLVYVGDQARFQIRREQVLDVTLLDGFPSWSRPLRVCVGFTQDDGGGRGHLALAVAEASSVHGSRRLTKNLKQQIDVWRAGSPAPGVTESLPRGLGPPETGGGHERVATLRRQFQKHLTNSDLRERCVDLGQPTFRSRLFVLEGRGLVCASGFGLVGDFSASPRLAVPRIPISVAADLGVGP